LEIERPVQEARRVGKGNGERPGNEPGRVGCLGRGKELDVAEFHNPVDRTVRETIPLWPPTAPRMTHGLIGRMLDQKLDVINARGSGVGAVRISIG
jgi:hypothetical protein